MSLRLDDCMGLHARYVRGCPGCLRIFLKQWGITPTRYNPTAHAATPDGVGVFTPEQMARVAREDRAAEVRLRGEERVAELERETNK